MESVFVEDFLPGCKSDSCSPTRTLFLVLHMGDILSGSLYVAYMWPLAMLLIIVHVGNIIQRAKRAVNMVL